MQKHYPLIQPIFNVLAAPTCAQPFANEVFVFKTNIQTNKDKLNIKPYFDKHPFIEDWNIDLEDMDCVLRVVSKHLAHRDIVNLVIQRGYCCEELI